MTQQSDLVGIWIMQGYNKLWDISSQEWVEYDMTHISSLEVRRDSMTSWLQKFDRIEWLNPNTLTLYQCGGITQYALQRQAELPLQCQHGGTPRTRDPELNFEVFWHYFDENYAFFNLRQVDWNEVYHIYRPKINADTTDEQLIEVFASILAYLGDLHVSLKAGTQVIESAKPHPLIVQWHKEFGLLDETRLYEAGDKKLRLVIQQDFLHGNGREGANGLLVWGEVVPHIGYLSVLAMEGFAGPGAPLTEELRVLNAGLDLVMADFQNFDAAIIDMRFNPGGYDAASLAIAGRFSNQRRLAFTKKARLGDSFTEVQEIYVEPQGDFQFSGPTVLLTSNATVSAAEIFTLSTMKFPHFTRMGGSTQGVLSDVLEKQLPNGWCLGISNEVYTASDGNLYEGIGIPVHITVPTFWDNFFYGGLQMGVNQATALLQDKLVKLGKQEQPDLKTFLESTRETYHLPGLAACIVRANQVAWSQGFGWSNIGQHIPMTPDTIMNIGSISKTVTATAVMQLWEQGLFKLDDDINSFLPFSVRNPFYPDLPITFHQLLTHTSSIVDGPAYEESYACGDPKISLQEWIQGYFIPSGPFYNASTNWGAWQPGSRYSYSNTAFGLLGYLVELLSSKSFGNYCRDYIFTPLGMTETSFYLADLEKSVHAVPYTYNVWDELRGRLLPASHDPHGGGQYQPNCLYGFPTISDGLVRTSVHQLAHFLIAFINSGVYLDQQILRRDTVELMLSQQLDSSFALDAGQVMGLTWDQFKTADGHLLWGHSGSDPGISTLLLLDPSRHTGVIVFTNTEGGLALRTIANSLFLEIENL